MEVFWHHFIRPEQKFNGIDALVEQISKDKEKQNHYLNLINNSGLCIIVKVPIPWLIDTPTIRSGIR